MVMIEAMACGTPVIAFRAGSSPEIVDDGVSGFLVDSVDDAVMAVRRLGRLDRRGARAAFESRFTVERVARDYLSVYESLPGVRARSRRMSGKLWFGADGAAAGRPANRDQDLRLDGRRLAGP